VPAAAAILHEEIQALTSGGAGGLSAALGSQFPRDHAPVKEPRGDARSIVETFMRVLEEQPDQIARIVRQTLSDPPPADGGGRETVLVVGAAGPVTAGEMARASLRLSNDDTETDDCALYVTDLIGPSGHRIPACHVRVSPCPAHIPGGGSADIQVEIRVPSGVGTGCYTGLLQSDDGEALRALVKVTVA
jgi:hypothetical protein